MGEKTISGPNPDLEGKQFLVTVTVSIFSVCHLFKRENFDFFFQYCIKINDLETTPVRCQIHHWSTEVEDRLPPSEDKIWTSPATPLFEEEAATFSILPQPLFKLKTAKV